MRLLGAWELHAPAATLLAGPWPRTIPAPGSRVAGIERSSEAGRMDWDLKLQIPRHGIGETEVDCFALTDRVSPRNVLQAPRRTLVDRHPAPLVRTAGSKLGTRQWRFSAAPGCWRTGGLSVGSRRPDRRRRRQVRTFQQRIVDRVDHCKSRHPTYTTGGHIAPCRATFREHWEGYIRPTDLSSVPQTLQPVLQRVIYEKTQAARQSNQRGGWRELHSSSWAGVWTRRHAQRKAISQGRGEPLA